MIKILILDGSYPNALSLASELKEDFGDRVSILALGNSSSDLVLKSSYCDVPIVQSNNNLDGLATELQSVVAQHAPDLIIPVGFRSVEAVAKIKTRLPESTKVLLPSEASIEVALSKTKTLELAKDLGVRVPEDYTAQVAAVIKNGRTSDLDSLPYPVFLKLSQEIGGNLTGVAESPESLLDTYKSMANQGYGDEILVQEFIRSEPTTYGCALLYANGEAILEFQHVETRSVPPLGGSATRAHIDFSDEVSTSSRKLLDALNWEGAALVEYKKDHNGAMVLMEINPKYWASYELASRNGYRFASETVRAIFGLEPNQQHRRRPDGRMVFPLRELAYAAKTRKPIAVVKSIGAMLFPPTPWDVKIRELPLYLSGYARRIRNLLSRNG